MLLPSHQSQNHHQARFSGDHEMKNRAKGGDIIHGQRKKRRSYGNPECMASRCCPCFAVSSIARRIGRCLFRCCSFVATFFVSADRISQGESKTN
ncbi:hypothetical protein OIU84_027312 [Salix udensis]|uniref:Uncharacterized protein n=1 Tax=Salix udensis TaxID=889485 RepID=A0AAD6KFJ8_9ROSI|nr:hypothetical protein OIU84_027312 [Salix udensis]